MSVLLCVTLLILSFIMFLMWLSRTRLHTKLLLNVPALASSSAFSLPQCPVWDFIHLICTVFSSASLVRALWQSVMDLLFCILLERACSADRLTLQKVICWLLKVISSSVAVVEDEFWFGNNPAVMFVNVKGMKEVDVGCSCKIVKCCIRCQWCRVFLWDS